MVQAQSFYQGQTLKQEQTLAPQQLQSLEILTVPLMELENKVDEELLSNPVLELESPGENSDSPADSDTSEDSSSEDFPDLRTEHAGEHDVSAPPEELDANRDDFTESLEKLLEEDPDAWHSFSSSSQDSYSGEDQKEAGEKHQFLFDSIPDEPSFQELLLEQLRFSECDPVLFSVAQEIIGSIDDSGYLQTALPDIAQASGVSLSMAEQALKLVQSFDPPGIGARDLRESLLLQLERKGQLHSPLAVLVRDHLDELARNKLPQVAKTMKLSLDELNDLLAELRTLNPNPASSLSPERAVFVVPEATVERDGDEFKVLPNRDAAPRLMISNNYMKLLEDPDVPDEAKIYIRQKINSGKQLIKSLEQRQSTILKIASLIVSCQHDFLKNGPSGLKPMTMQDIADRIGLHETTVSRAIANKYLQTPVGLFEFKYFFTGGFRSESGEDVSSRGIKEIIREIVSNENPASPLSDNKIMEILKERGFDVARRTIAKYREELGIRSSSMRKVF